MTMGLLRKIVKIDEEKCNGCGACVPNCVEGALQILNGKAKLVSDKYCDGLGACLGKCPEDAIIIEEREAEEFDEEAAQHQALSRPEAQLSHDGCLSSRLTQFESKVEEDRLPCGCSSATVTRLERPVVIQERGIAGPAESTLTHWPVQLTLVPPSAPFLQGADLLLAADCVPFAYPGFHHDLLKGRALLVACPKLDDFGAHLARLTSVLRKAEVKSLTVVHMEVPCCFGLVHMAEQGVADSGKDIPFQEITVGVRGDIKS